MQLHRASHLIAIVASAALIGACGGEEQQSGSASAAQGGTPDAAAQASAAVRDATKHMVSGVDVKEGKPGAPVSLWFDVKDRPAVGTPLAIDITLVPRSATEHMRMTFIATEGLTVKPAERAPEYRQVESGGVYRHTLTVIPREEGAYYLSAIVLMDLANGPEARTFSIPVVVGVPAEAAEKPEPPKDATGQPIESMPST